MQQGKLTSHVARVAMQQGLVYAGVDVMKHNIKKELLPLTEHQKEFVKYYIETDGDDMKAGELAGYSPWNTRALKAQVQRLLKNPLVIAAINKKKHNLTIKTVEPKVEYRAPPRPAPERMPAQILQVVEDHEILGKRDAQKLLSQAVLGELYYETLGRNGEIIELQWKPGERLKALELLGRTQRWFIDQVEHSGVNGDPIKVANLNIDVKTLTNEQIAVLKQVMLLSAPKKDPESK